ncbi:MAG: recombinase family protein, partial [Clostridia bacterium]|nr:recombinase family protein [Clostridia bacterium]
MNAVVYARFSSHRQGEQSIEGQVAEAERFAALHDLKIVHVYADRAQTGRNDNREQFQQMLADAAKHAFDALIVWKTDRIGRNKEEIALNKYHLKKNGVKIYYVAEAIPDTPEGIILESVIEGMAAYYSEQLSQNVRRGMRASAMKAQCTGGTRPLGYTTDENKKFIIDPKHAPTVKFVFDLYAQGKTVTEIVNELNARGLRTLKGKLFTHNSLHRMLKNKKYIGVYSYNNEVCIENAIPPIVDTETFNKVQELLKYNQKAAAHKKAKVDYLLTEKLFCGKCGTMMVGVCGTSKTGTRHHYYICTAQKKKLCTKKAVRQLWI